MLTSFVPKGQVALAVEGSRQANVTEEQVVQGAEKQVDPKVAASYVKTPSSFDRSKEPDYGAPAEAVVPNIWQAQLGAMQVLGIEINEVPLVDMEIVLDGGQLLESVDKVGVSNILAQMLTSGTLDKTPAELENAIKLLGASINVEANQEDIRVRVNTLAKNFEQTMALVKEIMLTPRWDKHEFSLIKQQTIAQMQQQQANPRDIAEDHFKQLIYGKKHIRAHNILGTAESVASINLDDVKAFYQQNMALNQARVHVVGAIDKKPVLAALSQLKTKQSVTVDSPKLASVTKPQQAKVYFFDVPNAKQTVVNIGYPALAATDPDYYPATIMNYILGGGSFASQLTQELREGKGYTYGIYSSFSGSQDPGPFRIFTQVRTNVTLESAQLIKQILEDYADKYSPEDLANSQSFLIKSNARAFETARAKLALLDNISKYNWPVDYVKQREQIVNKITVEEVKSLAKKYLDTNKMIWLFVGDAKTQLPRMAELGFGEPILLNPSTDK